MLFLCRKYLGRKAALPGGESSAQTDRIFVVLHCAWHADRAVHRKSCISRDTGRRASSDRLSIILLIAKGGVHAVGSFQHTDKKRS